MGTMKESKLGRNLSGKTAQRQYVLKGYTSEIAARAALIAGAPATLNGQNLQASDCEVEELLQMPDGSYWYNGLARWASPESNSDQTQAAGSFSVSFDIGTQTETVLFGLDAGTTYKRSGVPDRNFGGAINVDSDNRVNGVEILKPVQTFVINYTVNPSLINDAYVNNLSNYVGHVNSAEFKGYAAGELLLTRVSGQRRDGDAWDISFAFSVSRNKTSLLVGGEGGITVADKKGWYYLWVYSKEVENATTHVLEVQAQYATVVKVYDEAAYSGLGLP